MLLIILCYFLSKRRIISTFNSNPSPFFYNLLWWANSFFTASASTLSHNKKRKKKYPHQNILIIVPEKFKTAAKFLQNANWTPFPLFDSLSSRLIVESTQQNFTLSLINIPRKTEEENKLTLSAIVKIVFPSCINLERKCLK